MARGDEKPTIVAVILAAGESSRMGRPKALLRIGEVSFVRKVAETYCASAVSRVVVVLGAQAAEVEKELSGLDVTMVVNAGYQQGQLSSIIAGIKVTEQYNADALLVHPVDHPRVSRETVDELISKFTEYKSRIMVPVLNGQRGHPVLFAAEIFAELKNASPEVGARQVVWAHQAELREIETNDVGVIFNVNTPEDYEHLQRDLHSAT